MSGVIRMTPRGTAPTGRDRHPLPPGTGEALLELAAMLRTRRPDAATLVALTADESAETGSADLFPGHVHIALELVVAYRALLLPGWNAPQHEDHEYYRRLVEDLLGLLTRRQHAVLDSLERSTDDGAILAECAARRRTGARTPCLADELPPLPF